MSWPRGIYVATQSLGVYYTENFEGPETQPIWTAVNGGLPSTSLMEFHLDPFDNENIQYVMLSSDGGLYRRNNGGNWVQVLTAEEARIVSGRPYTAVSRFGGFHPDPTVEGRIWVHYNNGDNGWNNAEILLRSDDHGNTWSLAGIAKDGLYNYGSKGVRGRGNEVYLCASTGAGGSGSVYITTDGGATWIRYSLTSTNSSTVARINLLVPGGAYVSNNYNTGLHWVTTGGVATLLQSINNVRYDNMWFSRSDADHQRFLAGGRLHVTYDNWATISDAGAVTNAPYAFAPWAGYDEDQMLVALSGGDHIIGALYGEDDLSPTGIAGVSPGTSPYTDSIPNTHGGLARSGLQVVRAAGVVYTHAVEMPDYGGSARGIPQAGDRAVWEADSYPERHSKDLSDETYDYHTPLSNYNATEAPGVGDDSASGYAPGSRWVDVTNDTYYICLDASVGAAVWIEVMKRGDYDTDRDGLIDAAHGGTELDSSASNGIPHISAGVWNVLNRLSPGADSELTIATGAITVIQLYHRVDTEADAAADDLDTINGLANDGELLILHPENTARVVTLKHGTGNIYIPGGTDLVLNNSSYHVLLIYDAESTNWCVVGGGAGGGGGGGAGDVTGPASSTDNAIARFDGTGGKTIQNSAPTISDNGKMTIPNSATEPPLNVTERSTPPSAPTTGDLYLDDGTNTATGSPGWRRYNGAAWEDVGATGAGGTDANAIHHNVASEIHSITEKVTPVSADEIIIEDSAASYNKKRVQIGNLPAGGGGETDVLMVQVFS